MAMRVGAIVVKVGAGWEDVVGSHPQKPGEALVAP
jgi:hypothetical protein